MALFRDANGELVYAGPKFSDREKRVAQLYGALIDATNDPEGTGVTQVTTAPPPGVEPGQESIVNYQTGGSLKRLALHGRDIRSMPTRERFGESGRAGVESIHGFHPDYHGAGLMVPRSTTERPASMPQRSMPRRQAQDAMTVP